MKPKLLCILHRSPPMHGAAKVGDFIASSEKLHDNFECRFITIKSSDTIGDIGKVSFKKLYLVVELYMKVLWALLIFRPQVIYFTASIRSVAFFRDLLISTLWKIYRKFKPLEVFYHYHTKGINEFVTSSEKNSALTSSFVKGVHLILLSPLLEKDFDTISSYKKCFFLPNAVEDLIVDGHFDCDLDMKFQAGNNIEVLYLAHMMKDKGYWDVLELALQYKHQNIVFNFAGSWQDKLSESEFFDFIKTHNLSSSIIYHGFVSGSEKATLFKKCHVLVYPSKNDAFPLTLLESLSYGVPIIATNEGAIASIIDEESGIILSESLKLGEAFELVKNSLLNKKTSLYCRERFLSNFSLDQFEINLVNIISDKSKN